MTTEYKSIEYYTSCFEYPVLDKIHGMPTFITLTKMKKQLQSNAQSITSDLGGGGHGHLGLVLTPEEYSTVSNDAYVAPVHPSVLAIPRNADAAEAVRRENAFQKRIKLFRETVDVQKALMRQIVAAIDREYLAELRDEKTNFISKSIPEILDYLFDNFADVTAEEVMKEEERIANTFWNVIDPPMKIFTQIDDFQLLAKAAEVPRTDQMLISQALTVIQKTGDFEKGISEWFAKPTDQKTWSNFKRHFTRAHKDLRKVRGKTIRNTPYHQANNMVEKLTSDFQTMKSDLMESMSYMGQQQDSQVYTSPTSTSSSQGIQSTITPSINAVTNEELLRLLQQLQQQLQPPNQNLPPQNPRRITRRVVSKYCWTHGACAHSGKDCNTPKEGHKKEATFENRMGGSNYFCKVAADNNATGQQNNNM